MKIEGFSYNVTVRLVSSFYAELVFLLTLNTYVCSYCLLTNVISMFQNVPGQLCVFLTSTQKSSKGNATWPISCTGVDLFTVQNKKKCFKSNIMLSGKNEYSFAITLVR